ncbi:ComEA family DNA-binding protein [Sphaerisporangium album]|uniref:ComEA family DNA-binding protein n=1 Tax=Sphaerisporangium album TaxID=509200 RepID=A0A367FRQ2_9ACTN|nr:ComEA family DNA-binding protein [Sphaerisporangium album]
MPGLAPTTPIPLALSQPSAHRPPSQRCAGRFGYPQNGVRRVGPPVRPHNVPLVRTAGRPSERESGETRLRALTPLDRPWRPRPHASADHPSPAGEDMGHPSGAPATNLAGAGEYVRIRRADLWPGHDDAVSEDGGWAGRSEESSGDPSDPATPGNHAPSSRLRSEPLPFRSLRIRVSDALAQCAPLLDPGRPGLRVLAALGLLAALVGGIYAWRSRPSAEPVIPPLPVAGSTVSTNRSDLAAGSGLPAGTTAPVPPGAPAPPGPLATPQPTAQVIVHVTGKVRRPGVVMLPSGSRVADAVKAAGGAKSGEAGQLNLARKVIDGEQIVVGAPRGATVVTAPVPIPGSETPAEVLDLNAATPSQLETLPGVGEVLAARIVEYRQSHAGFRTVAQLREVTGIGERKFAGLRDRVRV